MIFKKSVVLISIVILVGVLGVSESFPAMSDALQKALVNCPKSIKLSAGKPHQFGGIDYLIGLLNLP
jgi:hypothetical protein